MSFFEKIQYRKKIKERPEYEWLVVKCFLDLRQGRLLGRMWESNFDDEGYDLFQRILRNEVSIEELKVCFPDTTKKDIFAATLLMFYFLKNNEIDP